jgi:hypothetical protein
VGEALGLGVGLGVGEGLGAAWLLHPASKPRSMVLRSNAARARDRGKAVMVADDKPMLGSAGGIPRDRR